MKLVILACLAAFSVAAPQPQEPQPIAILRDDRQDDGAGTFHYGFETENGIVVETSGSPGSEGQVNIDGFFRFPLPDGVIAEVRFLADENGFQPESELLPQPPPLPDHAQEQIATAERQRAEGITFDELGRRVRR
ncbi:cuticle protein AMP4-like [Panulirus ornatus]|uniref:cuticle protein AMP4-like n=1 Tax=Panulirus ornatus TaxID=150431 RepID=UPI003A86E6FD